MTDQAEAKQRIDELRRELERHNRLYYIDAAPEITDRDFDLLLRELIGLEKGNPEFFDDNSPSQRVGGKPIDGFVNTPHAQPMLSLDNLFTKEEVGAYANKYGGPFILEPKIDGISISVRYENGRFTQALTRGDGVTGDDVSSNLKTIRSLPLELHCEEPPEILEVRGEVYMNRKGFTELNELRMKEGLEPFANPRNACAGSMKMLDPKEVSARPLDIIFYATGELEGIVFNTHSELLKTLRSFGFKTAPYSPICSAADELWKSIEELDSMRDSFEYEIDGAVIKINDRSRYPELVGTSKFPHWASAYKYPPEQAQTTLNTITLQVGRTGVVTPVAELEPVLLAGTTVKRATLHNESEIRRKDIRVGDGVVIQKAGEIIPEVVRSLPRENESPLFEFPINCPECDEPLEARETEKRERGETRIIRTWFCTNIQCPAQLKTWLEHFASRGALDIDGIGGVVAQSLVENQLVNNPLDLYTLDFNSLAELNLGTVDEPRTFGAKTAEKVFQSLEKAKTKPFGKWIFALGIPKVGKICADHLATVFKDFDLLQISNLIPLRISLMEESEYAQRIAPGNKSNNPIVPRMKRLGLDKEIKKLKESQPTPSDQLKKLQRMRDDFYELEKPEYARRDKLKKDADERISRLKAQLVKIDIEILNGPAARSLLHFINSKEGWALCQKVESLRILTEDEDESSHTLEGKTFVITGTLPTMSREGAADLIKQHGGKVSSSVSKNTSFLLAGEKAGSKLDKAETLGVSIVSEEQLLALISSEIQLKPESEHVDPIIETDLFGDPI